MLWKMFITFFKIGAFTFGGGFAMIPIIKKEVVEKKNWIKDEDFIDIISIAQSSPGPIAVNSSIYVGYKIKGFSGAICSGLGTIMPSFLIILIIAKFFSGFSNNIIIEKIFMGIRPAVVALIISAIYGLVKNSQFNNLQLSLAVATALTIVFLDINPIYMIILGVIISITINKIRNKKTIDK
ncbi:MAG: chromate transporter [Tissierella sp.]|nr:chromate transporter [Tissierella sp.]